jgi:regulatory protein
MTKKSKYKTPKSEVGSQKSEIKSRTSNLRLQASDLRPHPLAPEQALQKLQTFCAYQERCIKEVKDKLKKLKVEPQYFNSIINKLKNDNFLNEDRYVKLFVSGKISHNKWGKVKIRYELIRKQLPESLINKALSEIDEETYLKVIQDAIKKKLKEFQKPLSVQDKNKLIRHMLSKGFEPTYIQNSLDIIL